jgi:tRNA-2-methylthio-N6-dimethylallyladenosine synthase
VPRTRGPERSRSSAAILAEARQLAAAGYTEVTLLGQNVNSYRDPSPAGWDFVELLARVAETEGIKRVRFTTSHPRDFTKDTVAAIDADERLCNHIHLPVQSGSDRVLERMQRQYDRERYMCLVGWIKQARRRIAITTDVIVGFPGEAGEDFQQTLSLVEDVGFDAIFSFKYSPRPNTAALLLDGSVDPQEQGRRLKILQERQRAIQLRRHALLTGTIQEVLVERFNEVTGQWVGHTSENRTVNFTDSGQAGSLLGRYMGVLVTRAGPNSLSGESYSGPGKGDKWKLR